jgi:hypothetical protein
MLSQHSTGADAQVATAEPIQMHFGSTENLFGRSLIASENRLRCTLSLRQRCLNCSYLFFNEAKLPATMQLFGRVTKSHGPGWHWLFYHGSPGRPTDAARQPDEQVPRASLDPRGGGFQWHRLQRWLRLPDL